MTFPFLPNNEMLSSFTEQKHNHNWNWSEQNIDHCAPWPPSKAERSMMDSADRDPDAALRKILAKTRYHLRKDGEDSVLF